MPLNPETLKAMNDLPDISGHDSPELRRLCEQSAREVKLVGSVSASTALEMIGHMRELEIKHRALIAEVERQAREIERLKPVVDEAVTWRRVGYERKDPFEYRIGPLLNAIDIYDIGHKRPCEEL